MNKKFKIVALIVVLLILGGSQTAYSSPKADVFLSEQYGPVNQIVIDVTYDPTTKTYSLGGLSADQLKLLGAPELNQAAWDILERFDNVSLRLNNSELSLETDGAKLASINWDQTSRQVLYQLVSSYGIALSDVSKGRAEEWLSYANVVLNIHKSPEISQPLKVDLATLLMVDIGSSGNLSVEGFDTGVTLDPVVYNTATYGGVENATVCWSKGNVFATVNGHTLPEIKVYQEGLSVIDDALNLGLGNTEPFFDSQIGASVSFGGATHTTGTCSK